MQHADTTYSVRELLRPLEPQLLRPDLSEICFSEPGTLFIEGSKGWERVDSDAFSCDWARALVIACAISEGRHLSAEYPFLSAALPHGLRLQAVLPPACRSGRVLLCLRRASAAALRYEDFNWSLEAAPAQPAARHPSRLAMLVGRNDFKRALQARHNIIVIGDTGAGKTAVLRTMLHMLPDTERLITIEDVHEIALRQQNSAQLMYGEGLGITASSCLRQALRLRPDRIILSECRGAEAFDFLQILLAGHRGAITTFHADSSEHAIERLALMARLHPASAGLDAALIHELAHRSIDIVVHTKRLIQHARICDVTFLH